MMKKKTTLSPYVYGVLLLFLLSGCLFSGNDSQGKDIDIEGVVWHLKSTTNNFTGDDEAMPIVIDLPDLDGDGKTEQSVIEFYDYFEDGTAYTVQLTRLNGGDFDSSKVTPEMESFYEGIEPFLGLHMASTPEPYSLEGKILTRGDRKYLLKQKRSKLSSSRKSERRSAITYHFSPAKDLTAEELKNAPTLPY